MEQFLCMAEGKEKVKTRNTLSFSENFRNVR